jgi:uncharacterized repeat protein (TIGR01451 family)
MAGEVTYSYDRAGRLVAAQYGSNTVSTYSYDLNGNLLNRATASATDADVQIEKSSDFFAITVGFDLNFTLAVSNAGPHPATGVTVTDPLPFGLVFSSGNASQGAFAYSNNTVIGDLGVLPAGAAASVTFAALPGVTNLTTNTAMVAANQADPNLANNSSSTLNRGLDPIFDSDGDGMANWWEERNGLNPFSSLGDDGANGDLDLDGVLNIDEWVADTRPNDNTSFPRIDAVEMQPGSLSLFFESSPIRIHLGQSGDALNPSVFNTFEAIPGTGRPISVTDTNHSGTNRFYRLEYREP